MIAGDRKGALFGIFWTIFLAIIFTACQAFEYYNAPFTIADSVYGSCFYFSTGFHGLHVIIGTIFLVVSFYRIISYQLTDSHHVGFLRVQISLMTCFQFFLYVKKNFFNYSHLIFNLLG